MKKYNKVKIPSEHKTYDQKVEFLIEEIEEAYEECVALEKTAVERAIRLGTWCNTFKAVVRKHKKGKWQEVIGKHLPHLSIRTVQRYMKLARKVDLDEYPALAFLGQTWLYQLMEFAGKTKVHEFLAKNDIDFEVDIEEEDSIDDFKLEVEELIERLKAAKPGKKQKEDQESDEEEDNDDSDENDEDDSDDDSDDNGDDDENEDDPPDDKPKNKMAEKSPSKAIIVELDQSANSFIRTINSVMENKKVIKAKLKKIDKIIKEVEAKLAALKKLRKSLKGGESKGN